MALSRCKTLEGIHLLSKIPSHKIIADDIVKQYVECIDKIINLDKNLIEVSNNSGI